jgi:hypothetical protein
MLIDQRGRAAVSMQPPTVVANSVAAAAIRSRCSAG